MEEVQLDDVIDIKFVFNTLSKRKVMDVFNHKCKTVYQISENDLVIENKKLILNVDMSKWTTSYPDIDFYNTFDFLKNMGMGKKIPEANYKYSFLNVIESLCRITNPKGGTPLTCIDAILLGYDKKMKSGFMFKNSFFKGKHTVIGTYDNGMKIVYYNKCLLKL